MGMLDLIRKKRAGQSLTEEEIEFLVAGVADGSLPDYQLSAFLMAVCFQGMTPAETAALTLHMARSGDMVDLSPIPGTKVDKHSTGGVGDKTTLVIAPLAAACGLKVAKLSGRGLGHTGGTLDKLESIPGFQVGLSRERFFSIVGQVGVCVAGQTGNIAPVDKRLYALRDVTGTVESLPLIASSVMSKKLASGADGIVLDVKCGSGAFMKTPEDARALAEAMVDIGRRQGRRMAAVLSNMDLPLGCEVGNANEVREALEILKGHGPEDLRELCLILAAHMVSFGGLPYERALEEVREKLERGAALCKFQEMVAAQGGNPQVAEDFTLLPQPKFIREVRAPRSGWLRHMDTEKYGLAACLLGAGRQRKDDPIDPAAGLTVLKKTGDPVAEGEPLARLYAGNESLFPAARQLLLDALSWSDTPVDRPQLVLGYLGE